MEPIDRLLAGKNLSMVQSRNAFGRLFSEPLNRSDFGLSLVVLIQKKGVSASELAGLVSLVRTREPRRRLPQIPYVTDGCGTGGDGTRSFNISTLACLVAAGAGARVAKHGNRSVSSHCGSADLLESLGVKIDAPFPRMVRALQTAGFGYFHAPIYHPLFKNVQLLRAALGRRGIKTIFNLTGPLVNPLRPPTQMIGVYRKDLVPVMAEAAKRLKLKRVLIVWSQSGLDELETKKRSFVILLRNGKLISKWFSPSGLSLKRAGPRDWTVNNKKDNLKIARRLLSGGDRGPRRDLVLLNAAAILYVSGRAGSIKEGLRLARLALESGSALRVLNGLIGVSHGA